MKLRILTLLTLLALLLTSMTACFNAPVDDSKDTGDTESTTDTSDDKAPATPVEVNVFTLNGTTGFGMAKLMNDAKNNAFTTEKYSFQVKSNAADVTAALVNGDADIAALPTNAAANLYNVTNGEIQILAVNTRGCLYLLTKGDVTVNSLNDLKGKTVYTPAQNPSFIFQEICQKNGLEIGTGADKVDINSTEFAEPANLREAILNDDKVQIAVLPEPMVTMVMASAKQNNISITNAMDLTAEWDKINPQGSLVQGCVVARKAFVQENPQTVANFLAAYEASINYLTTNTEEAAQMIEDNGIFAKAAVAKNAIPKCNVCYLDGAEMKTAMETYLNVLYLIAPKSIGNKLPAADFYYNAK